jgi:hypothetical protein
MGCRGRPRPDETLWHGVDLEARLPCTLGRNGSELTYFFLDSYDYDSIIYFCNYDSSISFFISATIVLCHWT